MKIEKFFGNFPTESENFPKIGGRKYETGRENASWPQGGWNAPDYLISFFLIYTP